uniref:auxilin-related protein 1-like n=1 Tax=Erigeron canadensis TaxID=72917 RepID=UPI001CB9CE9A|nr:auxilin-related protein 1-like [Erigeron canadensis]
MDDFGILARDFGFKPQGKSAPMKSDGIGSDFRTRSQSTSSSSSLFTNPDHLFNDVFGGPPKFNNNSNTTKSSDIDYDSIFRSSSSSKNNEVKSKSVGSNLPVYDKPVYDDENDVDDSIGGDIFGGLPGVKSKSMRNSSSVRYENNDDDDDDNVFAWSKKSEKKDDFDDLLGNLGHKEKEVAKSSKGGFDDLLPGFGSGTFVSSNRSNSESVPKSSSNKKTSNAMDDPFVVLESTSTPVASSSGVFIDPLETIPKVTKSRSTKTGGSVSTGMFDDIDPLQGFGKPSPAFSNEINNKKKERSPSKDGSRISSLRSSTRREPTEKSSYRYPETQLPKVPVEEFQESQPPVFDMPSIPKSSHKSVDRATSPPSYPESSSQVDVSPPSEEHVQSAEDIWLTVSEIPLFTQPTKAPPPSRPPPPIPRHASMPGGGYFASNPRTFRNDYSASPKSAKYPQSSNPFDHAAKSPLDDFENFAKYRTPDNHENNDGARYGEEVDSNSAAAAMKDAMDRAEAKFRHAKEVRERENAKASRNKESVRVQRDEMSEEEHDRQQREKEEQEREKSRLEREKARQAVERATREARERAAAEAREKASAEARLKVERAAVQRAQAEARERAAIDAKERAERAAAEARERASSEASERAATEAREKAAREKAAVARAEADARRRAERVAVERVNAEARERAAADARDRAAAAARMNQQKNDNDLESFFSSRASSAPRPRATTSDPASDPLSQNRRGPDGSQRTSTTGVPSNIRKASSTTNIVDDLSSIFEAAPSSAREFQDVEGETEERRRARLERQQRTQERAAKALAEKNNRDLQSQREQEERSRIGETLDIEIKRWAAGKEGNLRALLSTLQYVLWPGCGWQPVSLTDLITGAMVKKAYRKATLCIHPDKVQQKGANLQQKYVAEKVFDLLKEAWNKFNSEELF